jgi:hypothetical protein
MTVCSKPEFSANDSRAIDVIPILDHNLRCVERNLVAKAPENGLARVSLTQSWQIG